MIIDLDPISIAKHALFLLIFPMSVLDKIVDRKRERLVEARQKTSRSELITAIRDIEQPRDFNKALRRGSGGVRLIAEVKKASPSKGLIRQDFDHLRIAAVYEEKKVNAISVLTEEDFFQGRLEFLKEVARRVSMPVLRKDFIFDEYQIYEARAAGADAILLIAAILDKGQAGEYLHLSAELGMGVLFEIHDHEELETALRLNAPVIGINNRNLKTLDIDLATTLVLKKEIPVGRIVVSESGISTRGDVERIEEADVDAMLIGTALMKSNDIGGRIDELRGMK